MKPTDQVPASQALALVRTIEDGEAVERSVPYDRSKMIYNPATKQLLPIAKPPAVEIAELRNQVAAQEMRIQALEKAILRAPR